MELTTVAKPYANAIFEIANQGGSHNKWRDVLVAGSQLAEDSTVQAFVASPSASKTTKTETIIKLLNAALGRELDDQEANFIALLLNNDRVVVLPSVLALFDQMSNQSGNARAFRVSSAYALTQAEEKDIVKDLSAQFNTTVTIETQLDENLVGGIVIKEGDKVIDLSIQARVNELSSRLSVN